VNGSLRREPTKVVPGIDVDHRDRHNATMATITSAPKMNPIQSGMGVSTIEREAQEERGQSEKRC
jgi:hypothetical protein